MGAVHPTCLAPASMVKGDLSTGESMLIVGFNELRDFFPALIAQNINEQKLGVEAGSISLEINIPIAGAMNATPIELAHAFEQDAFRNQVIKAIAAQAKSYDRVGFPAALGIKQHATAVAHLEKQLNRPVFEISSLPPSVPGRRLYEALKAALLKAGGRLIIGSQIVEGAIENGRITQIRMETASRLKAVIANHYVLATGGIFGGGIFADAEGMVTEPIFNLPVAADTNRGTPQGGVASPLLANLTLDGMEQAIRSRIKPRHDQVNFIRYADDFVVTARTRATLEQIVKPAVVDFLAQRGLELSEQKTTLTHIEAGFNFLGQSVRKYQNKLVIKPAKEGLKALVQKSRACIKGMVGQMAQTLIKTLNPILRGWANYHRHVCSAEAFWCVDRIIRYQLLT